MPNPIANEPISASTVTVVVVWLAAKFAVNLDATTATAIAALVFVVAQWIARNLSIPLAKHDKVVDTVVAATVTGQTGTAAKP